MDLPKGTEIRCSKKRHLVGRLKAPLTPGVVMALSRLIDFAPGQSVADRKAKNQGQGQGQGRRVNDGTGAPPKMPGFGRRAQSVFAGIPTTCSVCGSPYFIAGNFHTDDGWKPETPYIEPVTRRKL